MKSSSFDRITGRYIDWKFDSRTKEYDFDDY
jgi:hypothetical protein